MSKISQALLSQASTRLRQAVEKLPPNGVDWEWRLQTEAFATEVDDFLEKMQQSEMEPKI